MDRCYNPKCDKYRYYGGRGITVSDQWKVFENFVSDMGSKPFPKATLERIDNSQGYGLWNCRWASQKEQARNTRSNHVLCSKGKRQCISAWAEETGIPAARIYARKRLGWNDDDAIFVPRDEVVIEFNGEKKPLREWAAIVGLKPTTLWYRIKIARWPINAALLTPRMTHRECALFTGHKPTTQPKET